MFFFQFSSIFIFLLQHGKLKIFISLISSEIQGSLYAISLPLKLIEKKFDDLFNFF